MSHKLWNTFLTWPYRKSLVGEKVITAVQLVFGYFLLAIPLRLLAWAHVQVAPGVKDAKKGTLFVANHQSSLDPFIILAHIPFHTFYGLLPIRFPVKHQWISKPLLSWLYLFGAYDIGFTHREKMMKLMFTRELLRQGTTVFLFPEGEVNKTGESSELKKGINFLISDSTNVIMVKMQGFHKRTLKGLLTTKRVLMYGSVVDARQPIDVVLEKLADHLKQSVPEF